MKIRENHNPNLRLVPRMGFLRVAHLLQIVATTSMFGLVACAVTRPVQGLYLHSVYTAPDRAENSTVHVVVQEGLKQGHPFLLCRAVRKTVLIPMARQLWKSSVQDDGVPKSEDRLVVDSKRKSWIESVAIPGAVVEIHVDLTGLRQPSWSARASVEGDFKVELSRLRSFLVENLADLPPKTPIRLRVGTSTQHIILSVSTDKLAEIVQ